MQRAAQEPREPRPHRVAGREVAAITTPCNPAFALLRAARSVVLLQGPVGPFFDRLAASLQGCATVTRVALHGGDRHDCRAVAPVCFRGPPEAWPGWLAALLAQVDADCIVLFGQARSHHREALAVADAAGVPVVVLEEGYFRPGFVTMEIGGVNSHSTSMQRFRWVPAGVEAAAHEPAPRATAWEFQKMAWHAAVHYLMLWLARREFPGYRHHRPAAPAFYIGWWLCNWGVKLRRALPDRWAARTLRGGGSPYFFVPLQHDGDAQIAHHSRYPRNVDFIIEVMRSFARHAPAGTLLVFKQHPHSRGRAGHAPLVRRLARELGVAHRVINLVDADAAELAARARGVVLINSTVGLLALGAGAPLKVMGEAVYEQPGITCSQPLDTFWRRPRAAATDVVSAFLVQLKNLTQMPASMYATRGEPLHWH